MLTFTRLLVVVLGVLLAAGGIALVAAFPGEVGAWIAGVILVLSGVGGVVAIIVERMRFRSERAEPAPQPARSPGGEPAGEPLGGAFRATDEVFIDPTSGRRMRVYLDPATGERRYRPEG